MVALIGVIRFATGWAGLVGAVVSTAASALPAGRVTAPNTASVPSTTRASRRVGENLAYVTGETRLLVIGDSQVVGWTARGATQPRASPTMLRRRGASCGRSWTGLDALHAPFRAPATILE